jgi:hypothetical protein
MLARLLIEGEQAGAPFTDFDPADGGWFDLELQNAVERKAEHPCNGCTNDIAVGDHGDDFPGCAACDALEMIHHPLLHFRHGFAARGRSIAAPFVPFPPAGIFFQFVEPPARPAPEIDLVERVDNSRCEIPAFADFRGRFARPLDWTRMKLVHSLSAQHRG